MRRATALFMAIGFLLLLYGCAAKKQIVTANDLVKALEGNGYKVLQADVPEHDSSLLHGEKILYEVNMGNGFQVYEYKTHELMEQEAKSISKDGYKIGGMNFDTIYKVYFYKSGNIIVYYCGKDDETIKALKDVMGESFAGADAITRGVT